MKDKNFEIAVAEGTEANNPEMGKCPLKVDMQDGNITGISLAEGAEISPKQIHAIYRQLTATKDDTLAYEIIDRGLGALPKNQSPQHNVNLAFHALADFEPADALESRLCLQANALYAQGMQYLSRAEAQEMMCLPITT